MPVSRLRLFAGNRFRYVRDLLLCKAERYLGGGAIVVVLPLFPCATVARSRVYGGNQQAGPLAGMFTSDTGEAVEEVHELIASITLALELVHIAAVVSRASCGARTSPAPWSPATSGRSSQSS